MPSPFPGMDPFLEDSEFFADVHACLITYFRDALQAVLPEPYYAASNERNWIESPSRSSIPDVNLVRGSGPSSSKGSNQSVMASTTAQDPILVYASQEEQRETYLDIWTGRGKEAKIVTTIEILSHSNKRPGEKGQKLYRRKQRDVLSAQIHLVEIDLLRGGRHTTAVPLGNFQTQVPRCDYHVCIHHFDEPDTFRIHAIQLADRLPTIAIPLLPGDGAVPLDLQAAFNRNYDAGSYQRRIDYTQAVPPPALSEEKALWVAQLLRDRGVLQDA